MAETNTERLIMRDWRESDLAPWAAMNADPEVRQFLGPVLTFEQSISMGPELPGRPGFRAVQVRESGQFIGFTGLQLLDDAMPFTDVYRKLGDSQHASAADQS